jgi:hypothetical protein
MLSQQKTQDGDAHEQTKSKRTNRPIKLGSKPNLHTNSESRSNSPIVSPNKYQVHNKQTDIKDEVWNCEMCKIQFTDPNYKLLECQGCREHYCMKCLGKPEAEYELLTTSDLMWFCCVCREKFERNIITDREIEERCKTYMADYEDRIKKLEISVAEKCSAQEVKEIVI